MRHIYCSPSWKHIKNFIIAENYSEELQNMHSNNSLSTADIHTPLPYKLTYALQIMSQKLHSINLRQKILWSTDHKLNGRKLQTLLIYWQIQLHEHRSFIDVQCYIDSNPTAVRQYICFKPFYNRYTMCSTHLASCVLRYSGYGHTQPISEFVKIYDQQ